MYGLTPIITARDKNTNYFGSEILTTKRLRDEIPYRMASHGTLEDFTDQTGWTNGAACILPDGTPGREKSSATTGTTANKVYDSVLDVKEYIIFNAYLEAGSQPSIFLADSTNTNSFSFDLTYRMKGTGYQQIQVSRNDFSVSSGSPAWDNIQRIAFRTLSSGIIRMGKIETYSPRYALCTLWHDDGYESFYTKVYEYLKTKNMRAVSALIGEYIGEIKYTRYVFSHLDESRSLGVGIPEWKIRNLQMACGFRDSPCASFFKFAWFVYCDIRGEVYYISISPKLNKIIDEAFEKGRPIDSKIPYVHYGRLESRADRCDAPPDFTRALFVPSQLWVHMGTIPEIKMLQIKSSAASIAFRALKKQKHK